MLDKLRLRVASDHTGLLEISFMGVLVGLVSGTIVIAFRLLVEGIQEGFLPGGDAENYEDLPTWLLFVLPAAGGIILGLLFQMLRPEQRAVGVAHTIERLDYHQGRLPFTNFLAQFFGAAVSIISGHSVGREGPCIHMGAAGGSFFGQWIKLPNNAIRILVACGSAAAIGASFNTPIAGVILTVEIILLEISVISLLPVILAAVAATALSHAIFGDMPLLDAAGLSTTSLSEIPWIVVTGIVIGLVGAAFIRLILFFTRMSSPWPIWIRMSIAGIFTGLCALIAPEIMSIGYDTVVDAMAGKIVLAALIIIVLVKLIATTAGLGLGLPGGLIGPTVFIGAAAGGAVGAFAHLISPETVSSPGLYALLGIGAMMGAAIQAPLAALMTMFELTQNPQIILPGMLAVAIAHLATVSLFKNGPVFRSLLQARGLDYRNDPVSQSLRRIGITRAMENDFVTLPQRLERSMLNAQLTDNVRWILVKEEQGNHYLMPAADAAAFLQREPDVQTIDLDSLPANRLDAGEMNSGVSLQEAWESIQEWNFDALYIRDPVTQAIVGIITAEDILTYHAPPAKPKMK